MPDYVPNISQKTLQNWAEILLKWPNMLPKWLPERLLEGLGAPGLVFRSSERRPGEGGVCVFGPSEGYLG